MTENSMSFSIISPENIAVNRFDYGAHGNELIKAKANPRKWLESQLKEIEFTDYAYKGKPCYMVNRSV